jgi:cytoskeletal protein RodZ
MTLGTTLQHARESAGMSINDLSEVTSIRIGLLMDLERNNFVGCGGDTYARGHLRNIAVKLGIEPQILIDLYNEEHSLEFRAIHELLIENHIVKVPIEAKKISWKLPAGISLSVLFIIGVVQIVISNQSSDISPRATTTPTVAASESVSPIASPEPVATSSAMPQSERITLTISATRGNSSIDIVVDGEHEFKGSMFQGETKSFEGQTAISVYLSNPAGLDLTLNGSALAPLGGQNEEVRRTFR